MRYGRLAIRGFLAVCVFVAAATGVAIGETDKCLKCHSDPEFAESGKGHVDRVAWQKGVHSGLECTDCHEGEDEKAFDAVPHRFGELSITRCDVCHKASDPEIIEEYARSVHAVRLKKEFACTDCHDPHSMLGERDKLPVEERRDLANRACLDCHKDADFRIAATPAADTPPKTSHDWLPNLEEHARMRCVVCHTAIEGDHDHLILPKEQAIRDCDACHAEDGVVVRKYLGPDDRETWITNRILFENAYVPGAVRNRLVDGIILALFGLATVGALGHGLLRVVMAGKRPRPTEAVETVAMYPVGLRLLHWSIALLFILLAITGLRLHFGGREDPILSFETAFHVHNLSGVALLLVGFLFFVRNAITGDWRQYIGRTQDGLRGIFVQTKYYLFGIFRGAPHPYHATPKRRFNPLQKITYAKMMYLFFPLLLLSGAVLLFPSILPEKLWGKPGGWWVATVHYLCSAVLILFLIGHLYLATTGDRIGDLIKAMLTGRHRRHDRGEEE